MSNNDIVLKLNRGDAYEWGALLATVLAFSEKDPPASLMESCHRSLCSFAIRGRMAHEPAWACRRQSIKPIYACCDIEQLDRDIGHLEKRLRHRMLAGKMCIPFLREAATGAVPELPPGISRLSISQMAGLICEEAGYSESKNVVSRIWRRSLPVIHIAAAVTIIGSECVRSGGRPMTIADLVIDPVIIRLVVEQAELYVPLLAKSRRAHVDVDSLIRVRLGS